MNPTTIPGPAADGAPRDASGRPRLILASASPRRRELLATLAANFEVRAAAVTEHEDEATDPGTMVAHNAALKADWVAAREPDAFVLGADTTIFLDGRALNKPLDGAEARAMLRRLSGRTHAVFTGLAMRRASADIRIDRSVASEVVFKPLDDDTIEAYLSRVNTLDKAGGYAIQEHPELIVAGHRGSYSNIVGLPLEATKQILMEVGLLR